MREGEARAEDAAFSSRVLLDTAVSPYCTVDARGVISWAGASMVELVGWQPAELVGRRLVEILEPESRARLAEMASRYQAADAPAGEWSGAGMLLDVRHADGGLVPCDVAVSTPARTGLDVFVLQFRRRGGGVHLEQALVEMAENLPLTRVLGRLATGLATDIARSRVEIHMEWDGTSFAASGSSDGYSVIADDVLSEPGERPWRRAMEEGAPVYFDDVDALPDSARRWVHKLELTSGLAAPVASGADGAVVAVVVLWRRGVVDWTFIPTRDLDHVVGLVGLVHTWNRGRESLRYAANHDPLTGLANRRTLLEHLRGPRVSGESGTVLFCDVDDFKPVNDVHGHAAGDAVLNVVGERLRQCVRPEDLVARYGGDEFVVYCHTTDPLRVDEIATRLEAALQRPITVRGVNVEIGLSVGRSVVTAEDDVDAVLAAASRDMSDAKRRRKASV